MAEHVYSSTVFWLFVTMVTNLMRVSLPFLFLVGCLLWFRRSMAKVAVLAAVGASLCVVGFLMRQFVPSVRWISLGMEHQPLEDQNPVIYLLYSYGFDVGYFLIATGLILFFMRKERPNSQLDTDARGASQPDR